MNEFSKLPGVGKKTAQRYAYKVISMTESEARAFADAIVDVKRAILQDLRKFHGGRGLRYL